MAALEMSTFDDFIQSDLFTFHVGQERRPFVVHSKAITATSPVFDSLINGGLKESQDRIADIEDVDSETFIRFLEYAYRQDYTTPTTDPGNGLNGLEQNGGSSGKAEKVRAAEKILDDWESCWVNSKSAPSDYGAVASIHSSTKPSATQTDTQSSFSKREYKHPADNTDRKLNPQSAPVANTSPSQNFTPVLLAHAQLYTFADMRMAQRLKDLVLHKLHKTLVTIELYPQRLADVVELVRYAYEHGEDRSEDGRIDALREMVVEFVISQLKGLSKCKEVRDLMEAGGEFVGDFWDLVSRR